MIPHIGFTGTRHGMSAEQRARVVLEIAQLVSVSIGAVVRHGLCVGGDEEFHEIVRPLRNVYIVGHPGPAWPDGPLCARGLICDGIMAPRPYMRRNADIVSVSRVMIAAPFEDTPQPRGGTWGTIAIARKALAAGKLERLIVVGRNGRLIEPAPVAGEIERP